MYGQQPNLNLPWTDVVSDDCTCSWINYSDNGGWYRKSTDPACPKHGYVNHDDRVRHQWDGA